MGKEKGPQATGAGRAFGRNLAQLREHTGLTQEDTAERAGLHRSAVAHIEQGRRLPRLDTIVKLAGAVEVEPCALLTGLAWELDPPKEGSE
jgi:transcriptional regulator with XRE-family HTH domain